MGARTEIEECAGTLDYLVKAGLVPGLLPEKVSKAATLLRSMAEEMASLKAALAAKHHIVKAEIVESGYQAEVRAEIVIADPRRYFGELRTDMFGLNDEAFLPYAARSLVANCTADWKRELEDMAEHEIYKAVRALKTAPPEEK